MTERGLYDVKAGVDPPWKNFWEHSGTLYRKDGRASVPGGNRFAAGEGGGLSGGGIGIFQSYETVYPDRGHLVSRYGALCAAGFPGM